MSDDLFDFWSQIAPDETVHPLDRPVLERVKHGFDLNCLPACFDGPLRTAPVVLLYLSPGLSPQDEVEAKNKAAQERYAEMRRGYRELTSREENEAHWRWRSSRIKAFGPWEEVRSRIATLNIGAYHSKRFVDDPLLAALPSSRTVLDYAQASLFPQAMRGERVVVCMRSARFWGLDGGHKHGEALFAPPVTRSGYMLAGPLRDYIVDVARAAIANGSR
jgi:hypothetical protein